MKDTRLKTLKKIDKPIGFALGRYLTTCLGIVRSLGKENIPTVWIDSKQLQPGFSSKYCTGFVCPNPKENEKEYIDSLLEIGQELNARGVLFPAGDIELLAILRHRKKLEKFYRIPMADLEISEKFTNKKFFSQELKKHNVPHPKTYFPNDESELKKIGNELNYPCFVKPLYSGSFRLDFIIKGFKVNSYNELLNGYKKARSKSHDVVIQEIIPGDVRNMYGFNTYFDKDFNANGIFAYKRIDEWPHEFGNGCLIEQVNEPELEKIITSFIRKVKYYGIVDAEFKKDSRDDQFKLIEINARPWMQNSLPTRCGVNIIYNTYLDTIGKKINKSQPPVKYARWLLSSNCMFSIISAAMKNKGISFSEWLRLFRDENEYAFFSWDDPLPFFTLYTKQSFIYVPKLINVRLKQN